MKLHNGIPGWFDFAWLYKDMVTRATGTPEAPSLFVECGALFGASSRFMADEIARQGKQDCINFIVVDSFDPAFSGCRPKMRAIMEEHGGFRKAFDHFTGGFKDAPFVQVVQQDALSWVTDRILKPEALSPLDFVYIDDDHTYQHVMDELEAFWLIMKPGGVMAGHDYSETSHHGVKQAVDETFPVFSVQGRTWMVDVPEPGTTLAQLFKGHKKDV